LVIANKLEEACIEAGRILDKEFQKPTTNFYAIIDLLQTVSIAKVPAKSKVKVLFYSAFAAIFKCLWHGLFGMLPLISKHASALQEGSADKIYPEIGTFCLEIVKGLEKKIDGGCLWDIVINFTASDMKTKYTSFADALNSHSSQTRSLFNEPGIYLAMVNGGSLQGKAISALSNGLIKGQVYQMEDGKT